MSNAIANFSFQEQSIKIFKCPNCGQNIDIINNIIKTNNNLKDILSGLRQQIENIINYNNSEINNIINQLKNILIIINNTIKEIINHNVNINSSMSNKINKNKNDNNKVFIYDYNNIYKMSNNFANMSTNINNNKFNQYNNFNINNNNNFKMNPQFCSQRNLQINNLNLNNNQMMNIMNLMNQQNFMQENNQMNGLIYNIMNFRTNQNNNNILNNNDDIKIEIIKGYFPFDVNTVVKIIEENLINGNVQEARNIKLKLENLYKKKWFVFIREIQKDNYDFKFSEFEDKEISTFHYNNYIIDVYPIGDFP